jgi:hypothetical protein
MEHIASKLGSHLQLLSNINAKAYAVMGSNIAMHNLPSMQPLLSLTA